MNGTKQHLGNLRSSAKSGLLPQFLPRNQHVVCVDMPGHEGTSRTGAEDYSIQGQVVRIQQVCRRGLNCCSSQRYRSWDSPSICVSLCVVCAEHRSGSETLPPGRGIHGGECRGRLCCHLPQTPVQRHFDMPGRSSRCLMDVLESASAPELKNTCSPSSSRSGLS